MKARSRMVGIRYRSLRWALVQLRRVAVRYGINFDNAAESSRKAVRRRDPQGRP